MAYWDAYDACMAAKHLPLLGEIFSQKTLGEAVELIEEIHHAIEVSGGAEITLEALALAGPTLGLSADGLEVLGVLAGAGASIAAHLYVSEAIGCLAAAVVTGGLLGELDTADPGFVKDQVSSQAAVA
jgi:hypothetical protein